MTLKQSIKEFAERLGDNESLLDRDYQHLVKDIEIHWGYPEFYPFIKKLLVIEEGRERSGFPLEVMQEIYVLTEIHDKLFPGKR